MHGGGGHGLDGDALEAMTVAIEPECETLGKRRGGLLMMRILVVEDEQSVASLISKSLSKQGFDKEIEENGDVACERALNEPFDAIVLDIMLPFGCQALVLGARLK